MRKFRLNRRGFTLIELLAVIVILAIIIIITVPTILDSMDTSRVSSLHTSAKGIANWYDEAVVTDGLVSYNERRLTGINVGTSWVCIGSLVNTASKTDNPKYGTKKLADMAELSDGDVNLGTTNVYNGNESSITASTCSSIRDGDNGVEVLLVAVKGGSFDVSNASVTYALSSAEGGVAR